MILRSKTRKTYIAGLFKGRPLFVDIESSGLVLSPAGGGKTVNFVIPALMHNDTSMVVNDLKGVLACITKRAREKHLGHKIYCINPAGRYTDRLGSSACYNPLQVLIDDWGDPERHCYLMLGAQGFASQLLPEPREQGENSFFRNGSRKLLVFAIIYLLTQRGTVTLTDMLRFLSDLMALEAELHVARSSDVLSGDLARLASDILGKLDSGDRRQFESFREGALQVLEPFAPSSILSKITAKSDFRFKDLKDRKTTVYIMADPTQQAACKPFLALMNYGAVTELIRYQNGKSVCLMLEEITNFKLEGLPSLMTSAREFKITMWLIVQELEQFAHMYGREAVETLLSQTEVKLIFGSRSTKTCKLISDMLGEKSIRVTNYNTGNNIKDKVTRSVSEAGRPLLKPDEVYRFKKMIVLVGQLPPLAVDPLGYHEIAPMRSRAGINPMFGKPFKGKVKARLGWFW